MAWLHCPAHSPPVGQFCGINAKQMGSFCASTSIYVPIPQFENGALKVNLLISSHFSPGGRAGVGMMADP
jgi:hypothetical protein